MGIGHIDHVLASNAFFFVSWRRHESPSFISETKEKHFAAIAKRYCNGEFTSDFIVVHFQISFV